MLMTREARPLPTAHRCAARDFDHNGFGRKWRWFMEKKNGAFLSHVLRTSQPKIRDERATKQDAKIIMSSTSYTRQVRHVRGIWAGSVISNAPYAKKHVFRMFGLKYLACGKFISRRLAWRNKNIHIYMLSIQDIC
jgi:hypothetical protein